MLGIIGAMDVEVNSIKSELENVEIKNIAAMDFYKGTLAGKEVVVVKCGVGKVNAAICAQILVSVFGVSALVNTGVAGSLNNDINICDIVVSTSALEHDMDVTPLGYAKGVIPDMDQSEFKADENLIKLAKDSAEEAGLDVVFMKALPTDKTVLSTVFQRMADGNLADLILTTGGTGFAPRDMTPEATNAVCDRMANGNDLWTQG